MRLQRCRQLVVLGAVLGGLALSTAGAAGPKGRDPVQKLVADLASPRFRDREAASHALDRLGARALAPLRQALHHPDPEVRRRCDALIGHIQKRIETEKLLEPGTVRLSYHNTPFQEALRDFNQRTGWELQVQGDTSNAAETVTLDTDELPLWEALEQFCRKAGLTEPRPTAAHAHSVDAANASALEQRRQLLLRQRLLMRRGGYDPSAGGVLSMRHLPVTVGPYVSLPTSRAGSVRVRALPPGTGNDGPARADGEYTVALEVLPEPRLRWQGVVQVRVDRAVDDHGQALTQGPTPDDGLAQFYGPNTIVFAEGGDVTAAQPQHSLLRLKRGKRPSKRLRELDGRVTARVQAPPQALMTVDHILKANGRTVHGPNGGSIKVLDVAQDDDEVKLRLQIVSGNGAGLWGGRGMVRRRVFPGGRVLITEETFGGPSPTLTLEDAKGHKFYQQNIRPLSIMRNWNTGGVVEEMQITYQSREGVGEPARFVYSGPRSVAIDIPFKLKDVPLP